MVRYRMAFLATRGALPSDPDETTLARLPLVLSAGGGDQGEGATAPHEHDGDELVLIARGRALITAGGADFVGRAGSLFLFPRGARHDQRNQRGTHSWFVVFRCRGRRFPDRPRVVDLAPGDPLRRWLPDISRHLRDGATGVAAALTLAVLERLGALDARLLAPRALPRPVSRALRLIEAQPTADLSAAALARAAGVAPSHLRTLFRRHLGASPGTVHRRVRLDLAAKLLRTSHLGVGEIAAACGWRDADYFARQFTRRFGSSPRAWRRR